MENCWLVSYTLKDYVEWESENVVSVIEDLWCLVLVTANSKKEAESKFRSVCTGVTEEIIIEPMLWAQDDVSELVVFTKNIKYNSQKG